MKPTYAHRSSYGLIALPPYLKQVGDMTQTVEDSARVLEVIAGQDKLDMTSSRNEVPAYTDALTKEIQDLKIAVPQEYLSEGVDPEVKESIEYALQMYELLGATWEVVSILILNMRLRRIILLLQLKPLQA